MDGKVIWIINQYASHLVTRHEELSKVFAEYGYKVIVITSGFHHGKHEYLYKKEIAVKNICKGVTYIYLRTWPQYQESGAKRMANMLSFCFLVGKYEKYIANIMGKPRYLIASSAPPFVWEIGNKISKKYKAKFIVEFRDIWPMSLVDLQGLKPNHPLVRIIGKIEKRAYRRADAIVSTMPYAWKHVIKVSNVKKEKVHWMANGINVKEVENDLNGPLELPKDITDFLTQHWCCVYIGSIVKSERVDYLLRSFGKVNDSSIYFAIIGDGNEKKRLESLAEKLEIRNVKFFSTIDRHLIPKALALSKVALAAVDDIPIHKFGLSMNKLNDYLAAGKPTLFACDVPNVVKEAGHFVVSINNENEMAEAIEEVKKLKKNEMDLLSTNAKRIISEKYDYSKIGKKYLIMLEEL